MILQFTSGVLQSITTWTNSGKQKWEVRFTYTSGNLTSVVEKDGSDVTIYKTLTYDADTLHQLQRISMSFAESSGVINRLEQTMT